MLLLEVEKKKKIELSKQLQMKGKIRNSRTELSLINLLRKVRFKGNLLLNVCLLIDKLRKTK